MKLGITMGDPAGIGPEILLKTYAAGRLPAGSLVIGDYTVLEHCMSTLGLRLPIEQLSAVPGPNETGEGIAVLDLGVAAAGAFPVGKVSKTAGEAARAYIVEAARLALAGSIDGICTLPVNKEAVRLSDPDFCGHTELIAGICESGTYAMMLASEKLIVSHVSTHIALSTAVSSLSAERIIDVIKLSNAALRGLRPKQRIAVAGLNPHSGEGGAFGREEIEIIRPAVECARKMGIDAEGPEAPDTVFHRAAGGRYDCVVAMYHDQGHIAMKVLDFDGGVNITLGLPIIRTSVDHGTAFDIAYQGRASTRSFELALDYAERLAARH